MKQIIKKPLITEKNTFHQEQGIYVFEVEKSASKEDIKHAVEKFFKVKVTSVNTAVCRGRAKVTRFGVGKRPYWKKAYIKLAAGDKIGLFEGA